jgi:hypothetical protein
MPRPGAGTMPLFKGLPQPRDSRIQPMVEIDKRTVGP